MSSPLVKRTNRGRPSTRALAGGILSVSKGGLRPNSAGGRLLLPICAVFCLAALMALIVNLSWSVATNSEGNDTGAIPFTNLPALEKHGNSVFNSRDSGMLSMARFDTDKSLLCYSDTTWSAKCQMMLLSQSLDLGPGPVMVVNSGTTDQLATKEIDARKSMVCYADGQMRHHGICKVLTANGLMLHAGHPYTVNDANTAYFALGQLDTNKNIFCYQNRGNKGWGTCKVLTVVGTKIRVGPSIVINDAPTVILAVRQLDNDKSCLCYEDGRNSWMTTCMVLRITGDTIEAGPTIVINGGSSGSTDEFAIGELDIDKSLVCYSDSETNHGTMCKLLIADGMNIEIGSTLQVNSSYAEVRTFARFAKNMGILCYCAGKGVCTGTCNLLTSVGSVLSAGPALTMHANTEKLAIGQMSTDKGLLCYHDGENSGYGTCTAITAIQANNTPR